MKIGLFVDTYYPQINGVIISADNLARELGKLGHEVCMFAPKFDGDVEHPDNVYLIPSAVVLKSEPVVPMPLPWGIQEYKKVYDTPFDIIHAHGNGFFSMLGYSVAKLRRIPYTLTFHTLFTQYTHYLLNGKLIKPDGVKVGMRIFGNACDGITTPSQKMASELVSYGITKPISVIPNFVDLSRFSSHHSTARRTEYGIPSDAFVLVAVGRVGKEKNFAFLVDILASLINSDVKYHLVIAGDGPELQNIQEKATALSLQNRVHFLGRVPYEEIPRIYEMSDLFVFASQSEVHPMCALESVSTGLPLVVVDDLAYSGIAIDSVNAYTVPLEIDAFTSKIELLSHDRELYEQYSQASRDMVVRDFLPASIASRMVAFYSDTITTYKQQ